MYMGEVKRTLIVRLSKQLQAVCRGTWRIALLYMYSRPMQHAIDWEYIIGQSIEGILPGYWPRRTFEAILIRKQPQNMNLDCGFHLPTVWNPLLIMNAHAPP